MSMIVVSSFIFFLLQKFLSLYVYVLLIRFSTILISLLIFVFYMIFVFYCSVFSFLKFFSIQNCISSKFISVNNDISSKFLFLLWVLVLYFCIFCCSGHYKINRIRDYGSMDILFLFVSCSL
jgi:hypothetical protein